MSVLIPLSSEKPRNDVTVQLGSAVFRIEYYWTDPLQVWSMDVFTSDEVRVAAGVRLVPDYPLAARIPIDGRPPGVFVLEDSTGKGELPGRYDLGERHQLFFQEYG